MRLPASTLLHGLFLISGVLLVLFPPQPSLSATQKPPGKTSTPGSEHAL